MKFEYYVFDATPYLQSQVQPSFVFRGVRPGYRYCVLTDAADGSHSVATANSDGVRVSVFGIATPPQKETTEGSEAGLTLTHGSLLVASALEVSAAFFEKLPSRESIERLIITLAHECHRLDEQRSRAYFGLVAELKG